MSFEPVLQAGLEQRALPSSRPGNDKHLWSVVDGNRACVFVACVNTVRVGERAKLLSERQDLLRVERFTVRLDHAADSSNGHHPRFPQITDPSGNQIGVYQA